MCKITDTVKQETFRITEHRSVWTADGSDVWSVTEFKYN